MRSKPCGDPSMGLRWPWAERRGAQGPPWPCTDKVMSRALPLLGERSTYQSRAQRAAVLILGQTPRNLIPHEVRIVRLLVAFCRHPRHGCPAQICTKKTEL